MSSSGPSGWFFSQRRAGVRASNWWRRRRAGRSRWEGSSQGAALRGSSTVRRHMSRLSCCFFQSHSGSRMPLCSGMSSWAAEGRSRSKRSFEAVSRPSWATAMRSMSAAARAGSSLSSSSWPRLTFTYSANDSRLSARKGRIRPFLPSGMSSRWAWRRRSAASWVLLAPSGRSAGVAGGSAWRRSRATGAGYSHRATGVGGRLAAGSAATLPGSVRAWRIARSAAASSAGSLRGSGRSATTASTSRR